MGRWLQNSLADLLLVRDQLGLHDVDDLAVVARSLGFELRDPPVEPAVPSRDEVPRDGLPPVVTTPLPTGAPGPAGPPDPGNGAIPSMVLAVPPTDEPLPSDLSDQLLHIDPLPRWVRTPLPQPAPLLDPSRARAMAFELSSTVGSSSTVDIERLVDMLARRMVVRAIPTLSRRTTALGAQLLIDGGPAMVPFRSDLASISRLVGSVVGSGRVERVWCRGTPWTVRTGGTDEHPYRPPPAGVPVVAVTELGLRRRQRVAEDAGPDTWLDLAELLRTRGSQLIALVPLDRERIPAHVAHRLVVIPWDRSTTVRHVRAQTGGSSRSAPR